MTEVTISTELIGRAKRVKLLLMDCDGVLTDGRLYFSSKGEEFKAFHVHDGQGVKLWHSAGFESGIITGRESKILSRRAEELGIRFVRQNCKDKVADCREILKQTGISFEEVAYIGDDLSDKALLELVGFPVLVANAVISLENDTCYYTNKNGGSGAIREVVEVLMAAQ